MRLYFKIKSGFIGSNLSGLTNDVWSFDGAAWTHFDHDSVAAGIQDAPWAPRSNANIVVFNNKLWMMGGITNPNGTGTGLMMFGLLMERSGPILTIIPRHLMLLMMPLGLREIVSVSAFLIINLAYRRLGSNFKHYGDACTRCLVF